VRPATDAPIAAATPTATTREVAGAAAAARPAVAVAAAAAATARATERLFLEALVIADHDRGAPERQQ
jgi:hypothetical protein